MINKSSYVVDIQTSNKGPNGNILISAKIIPNIILIYFLHKCFQQNNRYYLSIDNFNYLTNLSLNTHFDNHQVYSNTFSMPINIQGERHQEVVLQFDNKFNKTVISLNVAREIKKILSQYIDTIKIKKI